MPTFRPAEERFWEKVSKDGPLSPLDGTPCWLWTGAVNHKGYGQFNRGNNKLVGAHRFSYELWAGRPIPQRRQVDHRHTCPKSCVNPVHLRLTTHKENQENRTGPQARNKSGVRGVYQSRGGRWIVQINHNGRSKYFGTYPLLEDAARVARDKRLELFTHNNVDRELVNRL